MLEERIYFGASDRLPKGYDRFANMTDLVNASQIKRFGRYKVDSRRLNHILHPPNSKQEKKNKEDKAKIFTFDQTISRLRKLHEDGEPLTGQQIIRYNKAYDGLIKLGKTPKYPRINFNKKEEDIKLPKKAERQIDKEISKLLKKNKITDDDILKAEERLLENFDFNLLKKQSNKNKDLHVIFEMFLDNDFAQREAIHKHLKDGEKYEDIHENPKSKKIIKTIFKRLSGNEINIKKLIDNKVVTDNNFKISSQKPKEKKNFKSSLFGFQ